MPLINCELSLVLTLSRVYVIINMERRVITNTRTDVSPTNATFQIADTNLYVPLVTLPTEDDI